MKKTVIIIIVVSILIWVTISSLNNVDGIYMSNSLYGAVTMELRDGIVQTNILGFPVNGTYSVSGGYIEITLAQYGVSDKIRGRIDGDQIVFSDITLKKRK